MLQDHAGLQHLKEGRLNDESFAQQHCVQQGQQVVLRVAATTSNQVVVPLPEARQQRFGQGTLISEDLPVQGSSQGLRRLPAISIARCHLKSTSWPLCLMCRWRKPKNQPMVLRWKTRLAIPAPQQQQRHCTQAGQTPGATGIGRCCPGIARRCCPARCGDWISGQFFKEATAADAELPYLTIPRERSGKGQVGWLRT